jgi:hypothetical protein
MSYHSCVYLSISLQNAAFQSEALKLTVEHIPILVASLKCRAPKYRGFAAQYEVPRSSLFHSC